MARADAACVADDMIGRYDGARGPRDRFFCETLTLELQVRVQSRKYSVDDTQSDSVTQIPEIPVGLSVH